MPRVDLLQRVTTSPWRRKWLPVLIAVIALGGAVALIATAAARITAGAASARQEVDVHGLGSVATNDWQIGGRATLQSEVDHTRLVVRLSRTGTRERTPALTSNFDGSGGGEARVITCTAKPQTWSVPVGRTEHLALSCDTYVAPNAVHALKFVYVGPA